MSAYQSKTATKNIAALLRERAIRKIEGLRLYEPLPIQQLFHRSKARTRLARGSNRAAKTLVAAVEVARAVTGQDDKFPKADGRFFCIGKDLDHIGQVMWRKLGRAGAFRIIRDELSGAWRSYKPWQPYDAAYIEKAKPAPPLIPPRLIDSIGWENKRESIPNVVKLRNGWEMTFYSSLGTPQQGGDVDGVWFDEEIVNQAWYPEMTARLLDRRGRMIWSATPQAGTEQLFELHQRAEQEAEGDGQVAVAEFIFLLADNPYISEEAKREFIAGLTEDEFKVRVGGEFALLSAKVYPEFSKMVHIVDRMIGEEPWELAAKGWTRYAVIDPGFKVCAVLFAAIPPPSHGDFIYLYDELYLRDCNANMFGEAMQPKCREGHFEAFIIDTHMAIQTELGVGLTVAQQYEAALRNNRVASAKTGHGFALAKSMTTQDLKAGIMAVHDDLRIRADGSTRVRILKDSCLHLIWEIERYHHKRKPGGGYLDLPDQKRHSHCMDVLRYLSLYNPRYVRPAEKKRDPGGAVAMLKQKRAREKEKNGGSVIRLGPGSTVFTK